MTKEEFKAIILPQSPYMYRAAASVMRSENEAADVVQNVILKLYEKRGQLDKVKDIKSFCIQAIRNACLNIIRKRKEHLSLEEIADISSSEDIHNDLECRDMSDLIERVMKTFTQRPDESI